MTLPGVAGPARIKAIVNMSPQRSSSIPDIPTSDESGMQAYVSGSFGLFAPKATPPDIIAKLNEAPWWRRWPTLTC